MRDLGRVQAEQLLGLVEHEQGVPWNPGQPLDRIGPRPDDPRGQVVEPRHHPGRHQGRLAAAAGTRDRHERSTSNQVGQLVGLVLAPEEVVGVLWFEGGESVEGPWHGCSLAGQRTDTEGSAQSPSSFLVPPSVHGRQGDVVPPERVDNEELLAVPGVDHLDDVTEAKQSAVAVHEHDLTRLQSPCLQGD